MQVASMLLIQLQQMQRTVWLMAKTAGGEMTMDEAEMNPLWQIKYNRPDGSQTRLTIKAETLPEPTEKQIKTLAERLIGKQRALHEEALGVGLDSYPAAYIIGRLSPFAVQHDNTWISREDSDRISK